MMDRKRWKSEVECQFKYGVTHGEMDDGNGGMKERSRLYVDRWSDM